MLTENRKTEIRGLFAALAESRIEAEESEAEGQRDYDQLSRSIRIIGEWCEDHCRMCGVDVICDDVGPSYLAMFALVFCSASCEARWRDHQEKDYLELNPWVYCSASDLLS